MTIPLLGCAALTLACGCHQTRYAATEASWAPPRFQLDLGAYVGISGLAVQPAAADPTLHPGRGDPDSRIWAVPERQPVLLPLVLGGEGQHRTLRLAGAGLPIEGIDPGLDTESVDWTHADRIALGTEAHSDGRNADVILIAQLRQHPSGFVVRERVTVPYALWRTTARRNQGIEGVCSASGHLLVAVEAVLHQGRRRYAPIARVSLSDGTVVPLRLRLVTDTGKVSAMACRPGSVAGEIEALAIERHYRVARLLYFTVPAPSAAAATGVSPDGVALPPVIEPRHVVDLLPVFDGDPPNLEGLAWLSDGAVLLTSDNDTGGVNGPTEAALLAGAKP